MIVCVESPLITTTVRHVGGVISSTIIIYSEIDDGKGRVVPKPVVASFYRNSSKLLFIQLSIGVQVYVGTERPVTNTHHSNSFDCSTFDLFSPLFRHGSKMCGSFSRDSVS